MEAIYRLIGFGVVWGFLLFLAAAALWAAWHYRPRNRFTRKLGNAWVWLTVFVFGRRWLVPLEGARLLLTAYRDKTTLARWERDIIAVNMRYSHRLGWKEVG
jgi:tryptophan-rich sensory protein